MKLSLRVRLIISYVLISLFLVISLLFVGRYILNNHFKNYVQKNQEKNISEIVKQVTSSYKENGTPPSDDVFKSIGENALTKGLILSIKNNNGDIIWCMECESQKQCSDMITGMKHNMSMIYPDFKGEYMEKIYKINKNGVEYGNITLGYYGPFYYDNSDLQFIVMLNKVFAIGAILALISAILLGIFMANRITKPIYKVIEQTGRIERGNYKETIDFTSNTYEVDHLIESVNSLASTLNKQLLIRKRLARDYAHELRTPLASIQSNLEAMIDGIWKPSKERLESLHDEILRLTRMINDINKLVETDKESITLNKSTFDVLELVNSIAINFQPCSLEKNITLEVDGDSSSLYADRDKIGQVIVNLISNAIKYSRENSSIDVKVVELEDNIEISVIDTGIGIRQEEIPYIFEHLYRIDNSRSTNGSGVGLSVVKAIVDAHKGEVKVESEVSKGSKFTVVLPK